MRYFFHYFFVIPTNFRHSFGHPQNETPHKHRAQPSRNALFFRSTAPLPAKCSAAPEAAAKHKDRLPNVSFSRRSSVAPAGVEPTMGESKSPALPLGDGAKTCSGGHTAAPYNRVYHTFVQFSRAGREILAASSCPAVRGMV